MRDAKLIIMYSGRTHWVNWELRQVVQNECATRLILMIPEIKARLFARKEEVSARVEQVREGFKGSPWEEELLCFNDFARLRAMLFRPDGSMVMVNEPIAQPRLISLSGAGRASYADRLGRIE